MLAAPTRGATQNSLLHGPTADEESGTSAARRIHRQVRHRNPNQVDQGQPQPDGDRRESLRRTAIGGAKNGS